MKKYKTSLSPCAWSCLKLHALALFSAVVLSSHATAQNGTLVAREIMVITGISESTGLEQWPEDTTAAARLQAALEFMGYELHFRKVSDLAKDGFPQLSSSVAGIILESAISLPVETEGKFVDWLTASKTAGKKLLFIEAIPIRDHIEKRRLAKSLGLTGSLATPRNLSSVKFTRHDKSMLDYEIAAKPSRLGYLDLQAPNTNVYLSLTANSSSGTIHFDPVFTTSWGGMILAPYDIFQAGDIGGRLYVDIFKFFAKIWPEGTFPAPDVTTRDGLRSVFFHIDGDGFTTLSHSKRGVTSGKIITDQFLKKYPFPATVSIVEADIRAIQVGLRTEDRERYEAEAREMFALPNTEAASHTFSHPFIWIGNDVDEYDVYEDRFLKLKPEANYPAINYTREITGSADYIEQTLLPEGKKVEVLLWSGNCRPGPEALAAVRARGLVSLNGGDTIISKRHPGICGVAPRTTYWDGELQVYSPNQNDFVYTNDWEGPIYSGFAQAVDTFELTESPRRLKPVNVYYHFYSGAMLSSIAALHQVYKWCESQPLHSIDASTYARLARDSHLTKIYKVSDKHWRIVNEGYLRTFRIPKTLGYPDLAKSSGITGYNDSSNWRYIHTSGQKETRIILSQKPLQFLHLVSSSAEIEFNSIANDQAKFTANDLRNIQIVLGGAPPEEPCSIIINGKAQTLIADSQGRISLDLPPSVVASIHVGTDSQHSEQAAN